MTALAETLRDPERQQLRVQLQATMGAPRQARQTIDELEPLACYPYLRFMTQLLAAELVSNVLRHAGLAAGEHFELAINCDDHTVGVEVIDPGPGFNPLLLLRTHVANNAKHRGIVLLDALADRWGFRNEDRSFRVWFEVDLAPGHRPWNGRRPCNPHRDHQRREADPKPKQTMLAMSGKHEQRPPSG